MALFQRHKQSIAFEPLFVLLYKGPVGFVRGEAAIGPAQKAAAVFKQPAVVYPGGFALMPGKLLLSKQPLGCQQLRVDKIRVTRQGRRRLIGAVAIGGRIQRQHLPAFLAGVAEEIHKIIGFRAKSADAVFSR